MTQDEITRMAREAGLQPYYDEQVAAIARFAATVSATEREACAITAWSAGMDAHNESRGLPCDARDVGSKAANAIRARNKE